MLFNYLCIALASLSFFVALYYRFKFHFEQHKVHLLEHVIQSMPPHLVMQLLDIAEIDYTVERGEDNVRQNR